MKEMGFLSVFRVSASFASSGDGCIFVLLLRLNHGSSTAVGLWDLLTYVFHFSKPGPKTKILYNCKAISYLYLFQTYALFCLFQTYALFCLFFFISICSIVLFQARIPTAVFRFESLLG